MSKFNLNIWNIKIKFHRCHQMWESTGKTLFPVHPFKASSTQISPFISLSWYNTIIVAFTWVPIDGCTTIWHRTIFFQWDLSNTFWGGFLRTATTIFWASFVRSLWCKHLLSKMHALHQAHPQGGCNQKLAANTDVLAGISCDYLRVHSMFAGETFQRDNQSKIVDQLLIQHCIQYILSRISSNGKKNVFLVL